MNLSQLIARAQALLEEHGDLLVLDDDEYSILSMNHEVSDGSYPSDYDMPKGYEFIRIRDCQ